MRRLSLCNRCERTFDTSNIEVGCKFHCQCGTVIEVKQARGHNARVIKCANCGGPLDESGSACPYCKAQLTLHDRDLNTVCPKCLARVSDHAKFCHACSHAVSAPVLKIEDVNRVCPACGKGVRLQCRFVDGRQTLPILECGRCAGFWVQWQVFQALCQNSLRESPEKFLPVKAKDAQSEPIRVPRFYRQCPECGKAMNRINYAMRSGVVVDACTGGRHGIWFDMDELSKILTWLNFGGVADNRLTEDLSVVRVAESPDGGQPTTEGGPVRAVSDDEEGIYVVDDEVDLDVVLKELFK